MTRWHIIAYGLCAFGVALINNLWVSYYIETLARLKSMTDGWFYVSQVSECGIRMRTSSRPARRSLLQIVFAVWNSVNDPLCGYYADIISQGTHR